MKPVKVVNWYNTYTQKKSGSKTTYNEETHVN